MVWKLRASFTGALLRAESEEVTVFDIQFGMISPAIVLLKGLAGIHSSSVGKKERREIPVFLQIFSISFSFHH